MTRSRFRALFVLATLLLVIPVIAAAGIGQVRAQDATPVGTADIAPPPLAEAMPVETAAYVATDYDPTSDQYLELSSLAARLVIPSAGDTISSVVERLTQLLALIPSDLNTVLKGEVGVGISGFGAVDDLGSSNPGSIIGSLLPAYAIVLHPLEAGNARTLVEEWFSEQVTQNGGTMEKSQAGSIVVLRDPTVNTADSSAPALVAFSGDYIFLGTDYESLLPYIEATQGNGPTLADSVDLRRLNAALPADRLLFGYADISVLQASAGSLEIASVAVSSVDTPVGPTAFTIAADDAGLRLETVSIPMSAGANLPDSTGENPDFASRVPDSTLALLAGQDLGQSWVMLQLQKVLLSTLAGVLGAGDVDLSDFGIEDQFGFLAMLTGVNFKTDLIDQLQGNYGAALFTLDVDDPLGSSAVIASDLGDPDRVSVAVTSLGPLIQSSGAGMASVTTASIDGQTVNNVTVATDSLDATIQYGVVDDQLMVGLGDGVETLAVPATTTLETSASYQAALAELPETFDGVIYIDTQAIAHQFAPLLLESLSDGSSNAIVQCLAGEDSANSGTPSASSETDATGGNWIVDAGCSVLTRLLGGDDALLDLIVSRVPGPFTAVSYHEGGLQHVSGILLVGSLDS